MPREPAAPKEPKNTLNLAGSLPPAQHNGLMAMLDEMIADKGARHVAVVEFHALYDKRNNDDETHQVIVRWDRIEPVTGEDAETVTKLLDAARTTRLGLLDFPQGEFGSTGSEGAQVHNITDAQRRAVGDGQE